jgi:hypothetical protein
MRFFFRTEVPKMGNTKAISLGEKIFYAIAAFFVVAAAGFLCTALRDPDGIDLSGTWEAEYESMTAYWQVARILALFDGYDSEALTLEFDGNRFTATRFVLVYGWIDAPRGEPPPESSMIDPFMHIAGRAYVLFPADLNNLDNYERWESTGYETASPEGVVTKILRVVSSGSYEILEYGDLIRFNFPDGKYGVSSLAYEGDQMHIGVYDSLSRRN